MYPNTSITGHNSMYLYEKTVEECKDTCLTATNFLCVSFEHHPGGRICQFNTGNRWTLPYYFANYEGWNYYQRTCNAGIHFFSHSLRKHAYIVLTPLNPHFYIVKLGSVGVYIIFFLFLRKKKQQRLGVFIRTASARRF